MPGFVSGAVVFVLGTTLLGVALGYCAGGSGSADFGDTIVNLLFSEQNLANVLMHVQSFDSIRQARLPSLL